MKKFLLVISIFTVGLGGYAGDLSTVNQESVDIFIKILPELREIVSGQQGEASVNEIMVNSYKYKAKLEELLKKYGITMQELTILMQKISYGIAMVEMQKQNISSDTFGLGNMQSISEEELSVIERNLPRLREVF
ncbi:MAG: hypothetical protein GF375_04395, partial [Candidatus Omnitrophica bacterium]|nr:hypothetical protein [Candidatus Omnitrophota bacterium]